MCGIIGYIGKKPKRIGDIMQNALFNSYRGDDGIGIIYYQNGKYYIGKFKNRLNEIYTKKLDESRIVKRVRIGSIEKCEKDEDAYNKEQSKFEQTMDKLLNIESKFIFLHHRKATIGSTGNTKNLHPIEYNNKFYIHNGTAEAYSVKKWFELKDGETFNSETDTEVLAMVYNRLLDIHKNDIAKIHSDMEEMFPSGWGILIEIDRKGKVTIIKDSTRDIWKYTLNDDSTLLISEPTPFVKKYKSLMLLGVGIYEPSELDEEDGTDYTSKSRKVFNWWDDLLPQKHKIHSDDKCSCCQIVKTTVKTYNCTGQNYDNSFNNLCYECMVTIDETDDIEEKSIVDGQRCIYSTYLGDDK